MVIKRAISEAIRQGTSWDESWLGSDKGLIQSWETGRMLAGRNKELAERCLKGELPVLGWKGGIERELKGKHKKFGSLLYLAQWQGLRNEDLHIDLDTELKLTCSRTGIQVTFSQDIHRLINDSTEMDSKQDDRHSPRVLQQPLL